MSYKEEKYIDSDGQVLTKNIFSDGSIWYTNEQDSFHRLDGPAIVHFNGDQYWYRDGKYHRIGGPAVICTNGIISWYNDDKLHREDGPAMDWGNGTVEYWLNSERVSKRDIDLLWLKRQVEE